MTGEFNEETMGFVAIPRCGNVDIQREGRGKNSKNRQKCGRKCRKKSKEKSKKKCKTRCRKKRNLDNTKGKWRHTNLTYRIINYSSQLPSTDVGIYQSIIQRAAQNSASVQYRKSVTRFFAPDLILAEGPPLYSSQRPPNHPRALCD